MLENLVCGSLLYAGSCSGDFKRRQYSSMAIYRSGSMSNPFIAYDDGYSWPDLYTECDEMIEACVLVYLLAELRSLVRKGEATTKTETVMNMPLTSRDLMRIINASRPLLTSEEGTGCSIELATGVHSIKYCQHLLRTTDERCMRIKKQQNNYHNKHNNYYYHHSSGGQEVEDHDTDNSEAGGGGNTNNKQPAITDTTYITFDDDFKKEELTYAIGVNHKRRRITMCFRGSVVSNIDWATDFDAYMKEVKNPMKMHSSQQPTMKIHSKLHDLLYAESPRGNNNSGNNNNGSASGTTTSSGGGGGSSGGSGEVWTEFMAILQDKIRPATDNYPGYKLYITGYSQGGALATLFAFLAAAEPDAIIPKPVTCVSIASPYVGDESFRMAHQMLEGLGKLRHLRLSNHKDVVTASPKISFRWSFYNSTSDDGGGHLGSLFKHVGMNLKLYQYDKVCSNKDFHPPVPSSPMYTPSPSSFEITYPKVRYGFFMGNHFFDEMARGWDQSPFANFSCNPVEYWTWPWHNIREYNKRLARNKATLQKMSLNELYSKKDIVGNLGYQF